MKMTVKTGDNVLVIAGKDKGKSGKVSAVNAKEGTVLVENINIVTKHQKARTQNEKSGIFKRPAPIDASNVMVICPVCNKATRIAHAEIDGKKVRSCKKCGASLDKEFVKQTKKDAKKAIKASELKGANLKAVAEEKPAKTAAKSTTKAAEKKPATKTATKTTAAKSASKTTAAKTTTKKSTTEKKEAE